MSDNIKNAPIIEHQYLAGPKVVSIGDLRVARGKTRRPVSSCKHKAGTYDTTERRVWCQDCETELDSFDAFALLVGQWDRGMKNHDERERQIAQAEKFTARQRATKALDAEWRKLSTVPCCPHCNNGLMPEDVLSGFQTVTKETEVQRRKFKQEKNKK